MDISMPDKKQILAFGDSLTWGANPGGRGRHRFEDRWTSVVEENLIGVRVIAEGLGGRTTSFDDYSAMADRNGVKVLPTLLGSHYPLDLVAIMLGTNDLKFVNSNLRWVYEPGEFRVFVGGNSRDVVEGSLMGRP